MDLRAITYNYIEDDILKSKVVGIFDRSKLDNALEDIKIGFGSDKKIIIDKYDESCDNYLLEFDDENNSYFYSSNYTLNELIL